MQYDVKTPEEYLAVLADDWRKEKLLAIREMILSFAPEMQEMIQYKMLVYNNDQGDGFGLNAQKHFVALYVGTIGKIEGSNELLQGFDCGKGCIRVKKSIQLASTGLEEFIQKTIVMWREGKDTSC